jgi:hypothetical protein
MAFNDLFRRGIGPIRPPIKPPSMGGRGHRYPSKFNQFFQPRRRGKGLLDTYLDYLKKYGGLRSRNERPKHLAWPGTYKPREEQTFRERINPYEGFPEETPITSPLVLSEDPLKRDLGTKKADTTDSGNRWKDVISNTQIPQKNYAFDPNMVWDPVQGKIVKKPLDPFQEARDMHTEQLRLGGDTAIPPTESLIAPSGRTVEVPKTAIETAEELGFMIDPETGEYKRKKKEET